MNSNNLKTKKSKSISGMNLSKLAKTKSVKTIDLKVGQKVYYSEGISPEYYRGEIVECLKIAVRIKTVSGEIKTINKISLGIVI